MYYSTLPLPSKRQLDVATQLRDFSAGEISSTTSSNAIAVLRWHRHDHYKGVVDFRSYSSYTEGTSYWKVKVEVAPTEGESFIEIAMVNLIPSAKTVSIPLSRDMVAPLVEEVTDSPLIRVTAEKVGTPGALNYCAYLTVI